VIGSPKLLFDIQTTKTNRLIAPNGLRQITDAHLF